MGKTLTRKRFRPKQGVKVKRHLRRVNGVWKLIHKGKRR